MGQWYCCNDSLVSLSTLQEVLSEKAYILFFSRSNQRPAAAKTLVASNGTTSHEANGCETSKPQKFIGPLKPRAVQSFQKDDLASSKPHKFIRPLKDANMKPRTEQALQKENLVSFKVEKAPLKPHAKVSISVNLGAKRVSPMADKENSVSVSPTRVYTGSEKKFGTENGGNGVIENGSAPGSSSSNKHEVTLHPHERNSSSNGGDHHKDNLHPCESNGSRNGNDHQEIEKDGVSTTQSKALDSSTNEDPCILLRKDESSRDELEAIKERYLLRLFAFA